MLRPPPRSPLFPYTTLFRSAQGPIEALVEQFFPTARVEVEIVGPPPAVRDRIRAIPGVLSVQDQAVTNGDGRYVVEAARGRDVRAEIYSWPRSSGGTCWN